MKSPVWYRVFGIWGETQEHRILARTPSGLWRNKGGVFLFILGRGVQLHLCTGEGQVFSPGLFLPLVLLWPHITPASQLGVSDTCCGAGS